MNSVNKQIALTCLILLCSIILFEYSNIDLLLQDKLFNFESKHWLLDRNEKVAKFIFYDGYKDAYIIFVVVVLAVLLFFRKTQFVRAYKQGLLIVLISTCMVPLVVGVLKGASNTPCPRHLDHYNGDYPYVKVLASYPEGFHQEKKVKCWPAGHASAGFSLLSLFFLFKKRRNQVLALVSVMIVSWSIGSYKMLIGDHFLSHTVVTMVLAWLIILIIAKNVHRYIVVQK